MADLVKRLRSPSAVGAAQAAHEAAAEIEKLRGEIERLTAERDLWKATAERLADDNYPSPTNAAANTYDALAATRPDGG